MIKFSFFDWNLKPVLKKYASMKPQLSVPLGVNSENVSAELQIEMTDLSCDANLRNIFRHV
jgi:hypothetical protein